jgi:hypothetical protein
MNAEKLRRLRSDLEEQQQNLTSLGPDAELPDGVAWSLHTTFGDIQAALPGRVGQFVWRNYDRVAVALSQVSTARRKLDEAIAEAANGEPATERHPERFETAFAVYTWIRELGEGGAGYVYEVEDEDRNRYALKWLKPGGLTTARAKRFMNETAFCARKPHENIVPVEDWGCICLPPSAPS